MKQKIVTILSLMLTGSLFAFFLLGFIFINGAFGLNSTGIVTYALVTVPSLVLMVWSTWKLIVSIIRTYEAFRPIPKVKPAQEQAANKDAKTQD